MGEEREERRRGERRGEVGVVRGGVGGGGVGGGGVGGRGLGGVRAGSCPPTAFLSPVGMVGCGPAHPHSKKK